MGTAFVNDNVWSCFYTYRDGDNNGVSDGGSDGGGNGIYDGLTGNILIVQNPMMLIVRLFDEEQIESK